jgi:hypothetical protein
MVSFAVRPSLRALTLLALIAAVGAPRAGRTQQPDDEAALARITARIAEAQVNGGAYAEELIEPLRHLSLMYQENGDYALEAAVLEQALQVIRANYGLRSLEQAPLIRQRIRGAETAGNFAQAWDLEQSLLELAQRNRDDLRSVPIFQELGDKRMELLRRYLAGERPPQLVLGCYYEGPQRTLDPSRNCDAGSRSAAARHIVREAQGHYESAIEPLRGHEVTSSVELAELEDKVYRISYLLGDYRSGRQSLVRRIYDDTANAEPPLSRVDRIVQLADWDLRAQQWDLAFELYEEIYAYFEKRHDRAGGDAVFAPVTPIVLPTFLPNLFAPERAAGATGYVDVAFEITQFGTSRRIRVLDTTHNASKKAQQRVSRWIVENRFRPRMTDGRLAEAAPIVARHYVRE